MSATAWYVRLADGEQGPLSAAQLKALAACGRVIAGTAVRREGMDGWVDAGQVRGLLPDRSPPGNLPPPDHVQISRGGDRDRAAGVLPPLVPGPRAPAPSAPGPRATAAIPVRTPQAPPPTDNPFAAPRVDRPAERPRGARSGVFRSARTLSVVLLALLGGNLLVTAWDTYDNLATLAQIRRFNAEGDPAIFADDVGTAEWAIIGAVFAVALATVVVWCMWTHRLAANLRGLRTGGLSFTPGAAWGWFFCPIMNLFMPYKAMQEIWRWSDPRAVRARGATVTTRRHARGGQAGAAGGLVLAWWLVYLLSGMCDNASVRLHWRAESIDALELAAQVGLWSDAVGVPCIALAVALVVLVTRRQDARNEALIRVRRQEAAAAAAAAAEESASMAEDDDPPTDAGPQTEEPAQPVPHRRYGPRP